MKKQPKGTLEHFQEKWIPVFRPKMRQTQKAGARPASDEAGRAPDRRELLRSLGAGATVAVAAAAPLAGEARADTESNDEKRKSRYRETEHVKTFYRVNRYPG